MALVGEQRAELWASLDAFDDARAQAAFDRLLVDHSTDTVLRRAVLPYLHRLGERWESGNRSVAQEHFASAFLRERLMGLGRGWDRGDGPRALLACPPGERHDIGLMLFGLAARKLGWRITFLGADTPVDALAAAGDELEPDAVVLAAVMPERFWNATDKLARLAAERQLYVGAAGADERVAAGIGARLLGPSVLDAAGQLGAGVGPPRGTF